MGCEVAVSGALELEPEPRSVRRARVWICDELHRIGRQDLCDSAELGVSELVTNALLHSGPPITVRLTGTEANPRVEVHDASSTVPAMRDMTRDGRQTATVGRGLGIVATFSRTWGADVSETGKFVWFEPVSDPEADGMDAGLFDIEGLVPTEAASPEPTRVVVRLCGLPISMIARYQIWFEDLTRELRLLALTHGEEDWLASELVDTVNDSAAERRTYTGLGQIEAAMRAGQRSADIDLEVPDTAGPTMGRLLGLLERADELCREERTLTLPLDAEVVDVRTWYHAEFVRQVRGEPPRPWGTPHATDHP